MSFASTHDMTRHKLFSPYIHSFHSRILLATLKHAFCVSCFVCDLYPSIYKEKMSVFIGLIKYIDNVISQMYPTRLQATFPVRCLLYIWFLCGFKSDIWTWFLSNWRYEWKGEIVYYHIASAYESRELLKKSNQEKNVMPKQNITNYIWFWTETKLLMEKIWFSQCFFFLFGNKFDYIFQVCLQITFFLFHHQTYGNPYK